MAKIEEIAIDTNIALDMISYYDEYTHLEDNENYFTSLLVDYNEEIDKNSTALMEFIKTRLEKYVPKINTLKKLISKRNKNNNKDNDKDNQDARIDFNCLKNYYDSTTDEEKKFLTIKSMVNLYKTAKKDLKKYITQTDKIMKEVIEELNAKCENIREKISNGEISQDELVHEKKLYSTMIKQQVRFAKSLRNNLEFNKFFETDEKEFKEKYDPFCRIRQKIDAIDMCQKMVSNQVEIVIPEFVYEELCNHTKEFYPYDKIKQQKITNALILEKQLNAFTSNCTLSLIQDKHVKDYIKNIAYLLRSDIKDTISQHELEQNKGKFENFKGEDVGSCAKFADSKIAVYAYVSGIRVVTNNHDDFLGAEIAIIYSKENSKVIDVYRKETRRNLFSKMAKSGLKHGDKIILIDGPKSDNTIVGEAITVYEFNGKKLKEVNKSKVFKHTELNSKKLEDVKSKYKKEFKKADWISNFKKVTEITALGDYYKELKDINIMMNKTREDKEKNIITSLKEKEKKKQEKRKEKSKSGIDKPNNIIEADKELKQIEEKIRMVRENFELLKSSNKEVNNTSSARLLVEQSKNKTKDNNSQEK